MSVVRDERLLKLQLRLAQLERRERSQGDFLSFVRSMWPEFIAGEHHRLIAGKLERIASGDLKRLIVNMPPRHTKSEFASYLFPAWMMGRNPSMKIIQATHTTELAVSFGRKVKNLLDRDDYKDIFEVRLAADSKASGRWDTDRGGMYYAVGVGSNLAGRGGDLVIIDDPHSEQEAALAAGNPEVYQKVYEWYTSGPRQRLQPGGTIVIVMTRWADGDLTGRVLSDSMKRTTGEDWEVIELPAILPSGKPLWPEFWSLGELEALKEELPPSKWNAQYQQRPTGEEGAIVKRDWWKIWEEERAPQCQFIIQSWDTAFTKSERSDFSACTTWGVFYKDEDPKDVNVILLDAYQERLEFPELKAKALELYNEWQPDTCIIEAKAAGAPLIFELRRMGISIHDYTPTRGNDKFVRLNSVTDLFKSGKVWAPDMNWAREVIEQMAAFPNASHDDLVDSTTQALIRFRQGGFLRLDSDEDDEPVSFRRKVAYY